MVIKQVICSSVPVSSEIWKLVQGYRKTDSHLFLHLKPSPWKQATQAVDTHTHTDVEIFCCEYTPLLFKQPASSPITQFALFMLPAAKRGEKIQWQTSTVLTRQEYESGHHSNSVEISSTYISDHINFSLS